MSASAAVDVVLWPRLGEVNEGLMESEMKERAQVILSVRALLSSVRHMTLIVPYQSITIVPYARAVLRTSVCLGYNH